MKKNNQDGQGSNQALHYALMSSLKTGDLILDSVLKVLRDSSFVSFIFAALS